MRLKIRKPIRGALISTVVGIVCVVWLTTASRPASPIPLTVSFAGEAPGPPYRAAGFWLTNYPIGAIMLLRVQVQALVEGSWKTLSDKPPEFSPWYGASQSDFAPVLMEAGEHRKLAVEWPKERPWRVCLLYDREYKGASALAAKARILWHTRGRAINTRIWSTSTRVYSELTQQVFSQELAE